MRKLMLGLVLLLGGFSTVQPSEKAPLFHCDCWPNCKCEYDASKYTDCPCAAIKDNDKVCCGGCDCQRSADVPTRGIQCGPDHYSDEPALHVAYHSDEPKKADAPKPHLPTPPTPNCQCGCTETGKCTCKDCDHPCLEKDAKPADKPKQPAPAPATAPSVTMPNAMSMPANRLGRLQISYEGDDFAYQCSAGLDVFREYDPNANTVMLRLIGYVPGDYEVVAVACAGKKLSPFAKCVVTITGTAPPGPGPGPKPPDPGPTPGPAPIPLPGLRVLIVEESADRTKLPAKQLLIIQGQPMRDYLNAKCVKPTTPGDTRLADWFIFDKDVATGQLPQYWQDAMKRLHSPTPWILISNGTNGYEGPLPATPEDTQALINKYVLPGKGSK